MDGDLNEIQNQERLAKLEVQMDNVERTVTKIDTKFDAFTAYYVPRTEINEMFRARDDDIKDIRDDIKVMGENKWSIRRLWPAWLGVAMGVIPLIIDIVTGLKN